MDGRERGRKEEGGREDVRYLSLRQNIRFMRAVISTGFMLGT